MLKRMIKGFDSRQRDQKSKIFDCREVAPKTKTVFDLSGDFSRSESKYQVHAHDLVMSKFVLWSIVAFVVLANFLVSFVLIPFLVAFNWLFLDVVVFVIGVLMGVSFHFLLSTVTHLERRHHLLAAFVILFVALVNVFVMVVVSNGLAASLSLPVRQSPWLVAVIYGVAFVLPYALAEMHGWKW